MYPVSGTPFEFFESADSLAELGASFPLYFICAKSLLLYLFVVFFIAGLACLTANCLQNSQDEWVSPSIITQITPGSYGNPWATGEPSRVPLWQAVLHLATTGVLIVIAPFVYKKLRAKAVDLDISITTPSDFTVWVKGLPQEFTETELEEYLINNSRDEIQIVNIVRTHDIREFLKVASSLLEWNTRIELIKYKEKAESNAEDNKNCLGCRKKEYTKELCKVKIKELRLKEKSLIKEFTDSTSTSVAFVSFRTQVQCRSLARQWDTSKLTKVLLKMRLLISHNSLSLFKGKMLSIETAPEPSDVYWENLSASFQSKIIRRLITFLIAALTISITFVILYFIKLSTKTLSTNTNSKDAVKDRLASILSSFVVIILNIALSQLIRLYSKHEMHHTWSNYSLSVGNKLVLAMFLNTAIIPLVINYDCKTMWFDSGDLAVNIFWIQVANALVTPLIYLASPLYQFRRLRRWIAIKRGLENLSQQEANLLYEGPEVDLADCFADIIKSCLVAIFYAPLVPVGPLLAILGIVFKAAVFKYMLIHVHKRPRNQSHTLALEVSKWMRRFPGFYSIGILVFFYNLVPAMQMPMVVVVCLVWVYNCCFFEHLIDSRFKDQSLEVLNTLHKGNDKENDYFKRMPEFYTVRCMQDYERENPVTQGKGWKKWYEMIDEIRGKRDRDYRMFNRKHFRLGE